KYNTIWKGESINRFLNRNKEQIKALEELLTSINGPTLKEMMDGVIQGLDEFGRNVKKVNATSFGTMLSSAIKVAETELANYFTLLEQATMRLTSEVMSVDNLRRAIEDKFLVSLDIAAKSTTDFWTELFSPYRGVVGRDLLEETIRNIAQTTNEQGAVIGVFGENINEVSQRLHALRHELMSSEGEVAARYQSPEEGARTLYTLLKESQVRTGIADINNRILFENLRQEEILLRQISTNTGLSADRIAELSNTARQQLTDLHLLGVLNAKQAEQFDYLQTAVVGVTGSSSSELGKLLGAFAESGLDTSMLLYKHPEYQKLLATMPGLAEALDRIGVMINSGTITPENAQQVIHQTLLAPFQSMSEQLQMSASSLNSALNEARFGREGTQLIVEAIRNQRKEPIKLAESDGDIWIWKIYQFLQENFSGGLSGAIGFVIQALLGMGLMKILKTGWAWFTGALEFKDLISKGGLMLASLAGKIGEFIGSEKMTSFAAKTAAVAGKTGTIAGKAATTAATGVAEMGILKG
ncbi:MAG: hypothetical protein D6698_05505, partial [Gammaproteobacteria bacterium]